MINQVSVSGGGETNTANNSASDPTTISALPRYSISGTVRYAIPDANQSFPLVPGVTLNATGAADSAAQSDLSGGYQLSNLLGGNYTVTPSKTGDVKGINSLDATRIQQHLVGLTTLTANQLIAADTDGSGGVNSLDATRIQQQAVGIAAQNIIGQWKLTPGSRQYNALGGDQTGQDYQAVLVGEVSGNWAAALSFAQEAQADEPEILPATDDQNQISERFADQTLTSDRIGDDPPGRISEETSQSSVQSSDSSPDKSAAASGGEVIPVSLPSNVTRSTGASVTIPITIGVIPAGSAIESFDFSVFYNPAVLQPAAPAGNGGGTLSANCAVLPNSPLPGRVIVSGACAQAVTSGSGVLYNLTFDVIGGVNQTSALSFVNPANNGNTFQFNNGTPAAATADGDLTVLPPTSAAAAVSGRVLTNGGLGLMNARVTLTDANGGTRLVRSGAFGYFRFHEVAAGQTYIVSVGSKRYSFAPKVISVTAELTELNFTAQ